jgi:hypothetical protein
MAGVAAIIDQVVARQFGNASPQEQQNWRRLIGATGVHESNCFGQLRNGNGYGYYHMEAWVALSHLVDLVQGSQASWLDSLCISADLRRELESTHADYTRRLKSWNREAQRQYPGASEWAERLRRNQVASAQHHYFSVQAERLDIGRLLRSNHELATVLCAYHYKHAGVGSSVRMSAPLGLAALSKIWVDHYNLVGLAKEHFRKSAFVRRNAEPDAQAFHNLLQQPEGTARSVPVGSSRSRLSSLPAEMLPGTGRACG